MGIRKAPPRKLSSSPRTKVFQPGELFHAIFTTKRTPKTLVLKPGIPHKPMEGEDRETPRVSLASSPGGAVAALEPWNRYRYEDLGGIVFYTTTHPLRAVIPGKAVPDSMLTGEVWCRQGVPVVRVGIIAREEAAEFFKGIDNEWSYLNREKEWTTNDFKPHVAMSLNYHGDYGDVPGFAYLFEDEWGFPGSVQKFFKKEPIIC